MMNLQTETYQKYENQIEVINRFAQEEPQVFVRRVETQYGDSLAEAARFVARKTGGMELVMLAGPSSSGKTTTAQMLMKELEKQGIFSASISLDDFYRREEDSPRLPDGRPDFESVYALDIPEIQACLLELERTHRCYLPIFDFSSHAPKAEKRLLEIPDHSVVIVEGLHALNPLIAEGFPSDELLRIYLSVKQGIYDGDEELLTANDVRFIRRMVRDFHNRACSPQKMVTIWGDVMHGEYTYIKPFRPIANVHINTFHSYELCVLKEEAERLLASVSEEELSQQEQQLVHKVKKALEKAIPLPRTLVPGSSVLQEFIGAI